MAYAWRLAIAWQFLDDFIQRILDNSHRAVLNQLRNQIPHFRFFEHAFDRIPFYAFEARRWIKVATVGAVMLGISSMTFSSSPSGTLSLMPTLFSAESAPSSSSLICSIFALFHGSCQACFVGDQLRARFHQLMDDFQAVGANRAAGFRHFDDGIDQPFGGFGLGGAPGKFHFDGDFRSAK